MTVSPTDDFPRGVISSAECRGWAMAAAAQIAGDR